MKHFTKRLRKFTILLLCLILISSTTFVSSVEASTKTHSFNTGTGTLNVDYAKYLSKHDVVYNKPVMDPKSGLTVGNGRVGAMVWNSNGLTMQVSGVDTSPQTCFSAGLVNLYTNPGMDAEYTNYQQRLSLYDGIVTTKYDSNRTVTIMGSPNSEVMGIHVDDSRSKLSSISVDLSLWDLGALPGSSTGMGCDVPDMNTWKTVSTYADSAGAGLSRGQTDVTNFGYTLAASVEGADFSTQTVSSGRVRLNIKPTSSYTIWIACASRLNAPGNDSITQAKNLLSGVKAVGYSKTLTNYKNWWHNFWNKSFIQYTDKSGSADYMESIYYLSTYMIAAGSYGNYPFHFINGVFSGVKDDDSGKWSGAYWYWNQRDVYNSFLASNHIDAMSSFYNLYSRNFDVLKAYTMTKYGIDGIWVPETMGWDGNARHTEESEFTKNIMSTGSEVAQNMYMRYKYTNDEKFLKDTAYPLMKEVVKFYAAKLSYNSSTGKYFMASSNAHETYWNVQNAITDLAAVRSLFPMTLEASTILKVDSSIREQWQKILKNLQPYPVVSTGDSYLPHDPPVQNGHNDENVTSELIWPYDVTGIGSKDYDKALNSWLNRPYPYDNVWAPDAIQSARLGLGDGTFFGMKAMLEKYQNYPNGRTSNTNGEFEYLGVHLSAMNEALLHSYNDKIRVFPAVPSDESFNGKFTLLAKNGFLVSSEKENDEIKYVGIKSLYGKTATVINPWGPQKVQVRRVSDNAIIMTASGSDIKFNTKPGAVYVIERTSKKLGGYKYQKLTGTANQGQKVLSGTGCTMGLPKSSTPEAVFYPDANYRGTGIALAPGNYSMMELIAAGIPDDSVSSVKVPKGFVVEIYQDDYFEGQKWKLSTGDSNLADNGCNDAMSSVSIFKPANSQK